MENTILIPFHPEVREFIDMEPGTLKNLKYYKQMMGCNFFEASICKKNGCIYYSCNTLVFKKSKNSYYLQSKAKDGFTIDEKGKMKVWYGKNIFQLPHIDKVFEYFNFNWLTSHKIYPYITKSIFEKMVAGKITNTTDIIKAYFKAMRINASPALFLRTLNLSSITLSKTDFLRQASVAKDVNHLIEYLHDNQLCQDYTKHQIFNDMIQEAQILGKKIDYTWSLNKLKEVHKEWTEEIMKVEIDSLEDVSVDGIEYFDKFTPNGFKLLKTQKEVFAEGSRMKHCVYTAYWNTIKNGHYIAYHIDLDGEEATLGINIYDDKVSFNQCYSRYNQSTSDNLQCIARNFVDDLNKQLKEENYFLTKLITKTKQQYVELI